MTKHRIATVKPSRNDANIAAEQSHHNEGLKARPVDPKRANKIAANANRGRLTNKLLRSGFADEIDGIVYDTTVDEILVVAGDERDAAALYKTRSGHVYVHMASKNGEQIQPLNDAQVDKMRQLMLFWFPDDTPFSWFVDIMLFDGILPD